MEKHADTFRFEEFLGELGEETVSWRSGGDAIQFPFQPSTVISLAEPLVLNLSQVSGKTHATMHDGVVTTAVWQKSPCSSLIYTARRQATQKALKIGLSQVVPGREDDPPILHRACEFVKTMDGRIGLVRFSENPLLVRGIDPHDRIIQDIANPRLVCWYSTRGVLEDLSLTIPVGDAANQAPDELGTVQFTLVEKDFPLVTEECAERELDAQPIDAFSQIGLTLAPTLFSMRDIGRDERFLDVCNPTITETFSVPPRGTTLRVSGQETDLHCPFPLKLTRESIRTVIALILGRLIDLPPHDQEPPPPPSMDILDLPKSSRSR